MSTPLRFRWVQRMTHCHQPLELVRWERASDIDAEWWFRCARCGQQGFREEFDPLTLPLDAMLGPSR